MQDDRITRIQLLQLLQLADSALPVGAMAHSFGLETLVEEEGLQVADLELFFRDYLQEVGSLEASFCRIAHGLAGSQPQQKRIQSWIDLNHQLSAMKPAREVRAGSAILGRRLLQLVTGLGEWPVLTGSLAVASVDAQHGEVDIHYCIAFGLIGGTLGFDEETTSLAFLQQSLAGLVSACQRLLPLGQSQAARILWNLKPAIMEAVRRSETEFDEPTSFTPSIDIGAMRHPALATRLFIS